jgi:YesN/AraC family two-component response regulator
MISNAKKYSLMYVEDDLRSRTLYTRYFSHYFDTIYLATDGREGLSLYHQYHPDIVLVDINIPHMDGLSMISQIRRISKKAKVIVLTAFIDHDKLLQAIELNLIRYLKKPVTRKELIETLTKAILELETEKNKDIVLLKDNYWWDKTANLLFKENEIVRLSKSETVLMVHFIHSSGNVLTLDTVQNFSWEEAFTIDSFKSTLKRLRKKLPDNTIVNLFGVGHLLKTQQ